MYVYDHWVYLWDKPNRDQGRVDNLVPIPVKKEESKQEEWRWMEKYIPYDPSSENNLHWFVSFNRMR